MIREEVIIGGNEKIFLPIVTMSNGITIRLFDPYDMTNAQKVMMKLVPIINDLKENGYTTIVVPATKPVPIAWALACSENMNLVVLKKEVKPYYKKYKEFTCKSITSDTQNTMFITEDDYFHLNNHKVIFFDDVISTGATFNGSRKFLKEQCNIEDMFSLFVLKEGDSFKAEDNVVWLGEIPI